MKQIKAEMREELAEWLRSATTAIELRRALCVWLRIEHWLSPAEIADALGTTPAAVRTYQYRVFKHGAGYLGRPAPGGRREGRAYLVPEAEAALVKAFVKYGGRTVDVDRFRAAFERAAGRKVNRATIYRVLARHGVGRWVVGEAPVVRRPPSNPFED